jgi:hypothetical protein
LSPQPGKNHFQNHGRHPGHPTVGHRHLVGFVFGLRHGSPPAIVWRREKVKAARRFEGMSQSSFAINADTLACLPKDVKAQRFRNPFFLKLSEKFLILRRHRCLEPRDWRPQMEHR